MRSPDHPRLSLLKESLIYGKWVGDFFREQFELQAIVLSQATIFDRIQGNVGNFKLVPILFFTHFHFDGMLKF